MPSWLMISSSHHVCVWVRTGPMRILWAHQVFFTNVCKVRDVHVKLACPCEWNGCDQEIQLDTYVANRLPLVSSVSFSCGSERSASWREILMGWAQKEWKLPSQLQQSRYLLSIMKAGVQTHILQWTILNCSCHVLRELIWEKSSCAPGLDYTTSNCNSTWFPTKETCPE